MAFAAGAVAVACASFGADRVAEAAWIFAIQAFLALVCGLASSADAFLCPAVTFGSANGGAGEESAILIGGARLEAVVDFQAWVGGVTNAGCAAVCSRNT